MMKESDLLCANGAWLISLDDVFHSGAEISPRGMVTREVLNQTVQFDMNRPVCWHPERKLSYIFMAAEAYWITSGSMYVEDIAPYNKHISYFSDDDVIFNGNYGVPYLNQFEYVVQSLLKDPNTRQAVMTIWRPNPIKSKDIPCTISLVFSLRDHKLHTTVLMRSNDLWLGRPYDMFNFTIMTLRVLTRLNEEMQQEGRPMELGTMTFHAVSSHIYEQHFQGVGNVLSRRHNHFPDRMPSRCYSDWGYVVDSLIACRDKGDTTGLWKIRPEK